MTGNLIGENIDPYVFNQINSRQILYGKGYKGGASKPITPDELLLMNNNSSFLKLASGINIFQSNPIVTKDEFSNSEEFEDERSYQGRGNYTPDNTAIASNKEKLDDINEQILKNNLNQEAAAFTKLLTLGFSNKEITKFQQSNTLAKSAVLFNGLSSLSGTKLKPRAGISPSLDVWNPSSVYGLGGNKFGKQPMPGLISADIKCVNRGSIRSANIKIKAYNSFQFNLLELLYLRLGYTMLLEWGHVNYRDNEGKRQTVGSTITEKSFFNEGDRDQREVLEEIQTQRKVYQGNVDGFFGRVTNYSWSFAADGTYDIDLELYTLGDVVESLTVNVPAASVATNTGEKEVLKVVGNYTILDKWMDAYIATYGQNAVTGKGKYINLTSMNYNDGKYAYDKRNGWKEDNRYYCTFKELLSKLVEHCIPLVVGKTTYPMVDFDLSENLNIVSAQPNQISFDLEKVFIKPDAYIPGINPLSTISNSSIKKYFVLSTENNADLYYGQLMNCYLNFKFIKTCLKKNIDSDGNLSLYTFLVSICDGVNSSLGDVNKIQPIIKNGNEIVFIDQVQPKGLDSILKKLIPTINPPKTYPFILYGFEDNRSNFITSFSFESKIDSKLATSLAIGATAGNSSTALTDGTAFSTWNAGLVDRFSKQIIPASNVIDTAALEKAEKKETEEKLEELFNGDNTKSHFDWWGEDTRSGKIDLFSFKELTFEQFKSEYTTFINQNPTLQSKDAWLKEPKTTNYQSLLAKNLGGKIKDVGTFSGVDASYLNIEDKNNYSQLKQSFKKYIQTRDEKIYKITNSASQREGFIPLNLTLTLIGLSGIKIYQKFPIVASFLPSQYNTNTDDGTLESVVQTVDHKISNNKWETSISTIIFPKSTPTEVNLIDNSLFAFLGVDEEYNFDSFVKSTPWSAVFISYLATSTGVKFPPRASHTAYAQAIRDGNEGWTVFDPRAGGTGYTPEQRNQRRIGRVRGNEDTVYYASNRDSSLTTSYKSIQIGDIIIKNRGTNNLTYSTNPYQDMSHGDIVTEISDTTITLIGGNVGDTVKKSYYQITKKSVIVESGNTQPDVTWSTSGAVDTSQGEGKLVFTALRCNDHSQALIMVAKAIEEEKLWQSKGWKDDNVASFNTLTNYYESSNGTKNYPKSGIPKLETTTT
tara:strand:- start:915 stop:4376 length:3462 start_codon:yes stop_codon:yes gene_type:complete